MRSRLKVCNIHGYYDAVVNEVCPACKAEQQLATARREGWEQCRMECVDVAEKHASNPFAGAMAEKIADAIAAMEYKEKAND